MCSPDGECSIRQSFQGFVDHLYLQFCFLADKVIYSERLCSMKTNYYEQSFLGASYFIKDQTY